MTDQDTQVAEQTTSSGFDVDKLDGVEKASILLLSLSEEDAAQILKHLEPKQVQKVVDEALRNTQSIVEEEKKVLTEEEAWQRVWNRARYNYDTNTSNLEVPEYIERNTITGEERPYTG